MHIPLIPLRRTTRRTDPLPVTMSGVRMGERVLQVGVDDPRIVGIIAAKVGVSGHAAVLLSSDDQVARVRKALEHAGALADVSVGSLQMLDFPDAAFDAVVIHGRADPLTASPEEPRPGLTEFYRVLRQGGRLVVIQRGTPTGLASLFRSGSRGDSASARADETVAALGRAGFRPARLIADREGTLFSEGIKGSSGQDTPASPLSNPA
jgi:ubiquinone/menaquinone biosynthesis C-methylase UbiE